MQLSKRPTMKYPPLKNTYIDKNGADILYSLKIQTIKR